MSPGNNDPRRQMGHDLQERVDNLVAEIEEFAYTPDKPKKACKSFVIVRVGLDICAECQRPRGEHPRALQKAKR